MAETISVSKSPGVGSGSAKKMNGDESDISGSTPGAGPLGQIVSGVMLFFEFILLNLRCWFQIFASLFSIFLPVEEKSVAGEVVLVTGAGHGIGREIALKYASLGSTLVCVDINEKGNAETVKQITSLGATKAYAYKCDVSNRDEVQAVAAKIRQEVGPVTVLVNNAGIMPINPLMKHNSQEIRRVFDINVLAHFWMLEAFLPSMMEQQHGHIVSISSMCGVWGTSNCVPYCASKFAVRGLMEALAVEQYDLRPELMEKVRFTTVYPYMVNTGLVKNSKIRFEKAMPALDPAQVADEVVRAMRRNEHEVSVPRWNFHFNTVVRMFPRTAQTYMRDFFQISILPE